MTRHSLDIMSPAESLYLMRKCKSRPNPPIFDPIRFRHVCSQVQAKSQTSTRDLFSFHDPQPLKINGKDLTQSKTCTRALFLQMCVRMRTYGCIVQKPKDCSTRQVPLKNMEDNTKRTSRSHKNTTFVVRYIPLHVRVFGEVCEDPNCLHSFSFVETNII